MKQEFMNETLLTIRNRMKIYGEFRKYCIRRKSKSNNKSMKEIASNGIEVHLESFVGDTKSKIVDYYTSNKETDTTYIENNRYKSQDEYPDETKIEGLTYMSTQESDMRIDHHSKIKKYQYELNKIFRIPSMQKANFIRQVDPMNLDQSIKKIDPIKSKTIFKFNRSKKSQDEILQPKITEFNNYTLGSFTTDPISINCDTELTHLKLINAPSQQEEIKNNLSPKLDLETISNMNSYESIIQHRQIKIKNESSLGYYIL